MNGNIIYSIKTTISMDVERAAIIIQRWFRSKLTKTPCLISHQAFVADYEIILDKQVYNANELFANLKYSTKVPHTRREMTLDEIDTIIVKHNPFVNIVYHATETTPQSSSPPRPIVLHLTRSVILEI